MQNLLVTVVILLVLLAVFFFGGVLVRGRLYASLQKDLDAAGTGDGASLERLFKRLGSPLVRAFLSPFAQQRLRFLGLAAKGDRMGMKAQFNRLMKLKGTAFERSKLLVDGFNAFAAAGDRTHCRRILEEMAVAGFTEKALAAYRRHFDIVLAGKTTGCQGLENKYATLSGHRRGYAAYLLSCAYKTRGDIEGAAAKLAEASKLYGMSEDDLPGRIHVNTTI